METMKMSSDSIEVSAAQAISVHLQYLRKELDGIAEAMATMATKADIENLRKDLGGYATKDSVATLSERVKSLENATKENTLGTVVKRGATNFLLALAVIGAIGGVVGFAIEAVHWYDRNK